MLTGNGCSVIGFLLDNIMAYKLNLNYAHNERFHYVLEYVSFVKYENNW